VVNRELVIGIVAKQSLRPAEPEKSFVAKAAACPELPQERKE
jgi:hypothetical protein